jgi:hypothetical protein
MGARGVALALLVACGAPQHAAPAADLPARVAADFETAVKTSKDAYVALFDFEAVGEYEILLHRYDLLGRFPDLDDGRRAQYTGEDGTPYPPTRERRNVGNFYPILAQRTVGTGGCTASAPQSRYGKLLGTEFEPHAGIPVKYEKLRTDANGWLARGGVVGIHCTGGQGGLAVVYTARDNPRGYDLITIYDDRADDVP